MKVDRRHGPVLPAGLTCWPDKRDLFAADTYFWEGWEDLVAIAGDRALQVARDHTLLLLKPDAIATRNLSPTLEWLDAHGFTVVAADSVRIDRHTIRLLWRYQWNIARRERKDACDLLLPSADSLCLLVRKPLDCSVLPASVLFTRLKGPADPALRKPGQLRHLLGNRSTLLNFVHSADEPADVVRELAICLEPEHRRSRWRAAYERHDARASAAALVESLYASVPEHSLHLEGALESLRTRVRRQGNLAESVRAHLSSQLAVIAEGGSRDWRRVLDLLDEAKVATEEWDRITLAAHLIKMDYDEWQVLLPGIKEEHWTRSLREGGVEDSKHDSARGGVPS